MSVVTKRPCNNFQGSHSVGSPSLHPMICHKPYEYWSLLFGPGRVCSLGRPRSSSDCANIQSPRVARSGIPQAEPPIVSRSRTVYSRVSADQHSKPYATWSDTLPEHNDHINSPTLDRKHLASTHLLSPDLGLPGILVEPHQHADVFPQRFTPLPSLPKLTAAKEFLQTYWHVPAGIYYYRRTPLALKNHTQRTFEMMVTAGYLLEDATGFRWFPSGDYELFKCKEDALMKAAENIDRPSLACEHPGQLQPKISLVTPEQQQRQLQMNTDSTLQERRAVTLESSLLKAHNPKYPWNEDKPDPNYVSLFPRWTFPEGICYRESAPWYPHMTRSDIEDAVTSGYLVEDAIGLRIAYSNQYKLFHNGEGAENELLDSVPTILPLKLKGPSGEMKESKKQIEPAYEGKVILYDMPLYPPHVIDSSTVQPPPSGTPIAEEDTFLTERPKLDRRATSLLDQGLGRRCPRARFNGSCTILDRMGVVRKEKVVDKPEKWGKMRKEHSEKMRKEKEEERELMASLLRLKSIPWTHPHAAKE